MRKNHQTRGSVAAFCLLAMTVLIIGSLGVSGMTMSSLRRSRGDRKAMVAFQGAQGALEQAIAKAYEYSEANKGRFPSATWDMASAIHEFAPGCQATAVIVPEPDWPLNAWVTVNSNYEGKKHSLRVHLRARDLGIWNNAIFAGQGAAGKAINGNVDIRGSVHLLGQGESYTDLNGNGQRDAAETWTEKKPNNGKWDPGEAFIDSNGDGVWSSAEPFNDTNRNGIYEAPLTPADLNSSLSGNAYIGNNYNGLDATLKSLIADPPEVNGVATLNAEVRVQHGQLQIGGAAKIGTDQVVDGGLSKGTIDGSYVSDGYRGSSANSVYSDNGTSESYDLESKKLTMPLLAGTEADEFIDPKTGTKYLNQETFLTTKGYKVSLSEIKSSGAAFAYIDPTNSVNFIKFKPAASGQPATLEVSGIVWVSGSLSVNGDIRFKGKGTIYSQGDVNISGNVLPLVGTKFPTDTVIGWITKGNMEVGSSSHNSIAGAFYAQGTVKTSKQTKILGTIVGTYFDMGTNVPNIFQVPSLAQNLPGGMPGDKSIISIKIRGWRQRPPGT